MIIEINIEIKKDKHDYNGLAKTSVSIDSDQVDPMAVTTIANGLIESALARAFAKKVPMPIEREIPPLRPIEVMPAELSEEPL